MFASDGEELRGKLPVLGLLTYAGIMPLLRSTKGDFDEAAGKVKRTA